MAFVRATTTFHLPGPVTVYTGDIFDADDAVVKQCAVFFEPVESAAKRSAEIVDAMAKPGVKRGGK